jgi:hypothetical protein
MATLCVSAPTGMVPTTLLVAGSTRTTAAVIRGIDAEELPVGACHPHSTVAERYAGGAAGHADLRDHLAQVGALVADAVGDSDALESSLEEQPLAEMASAMQAAKTTWYRSCVRAERWRTSSGR